MDLSIVIPIFNTELGKLKRCLDSVAAIDKLTFECLLIDDGSEEQVGAFCRGYSQNDARFVYYWQKNSGVSAARNAGIDAAKGRYICFVDSDDYILPEVYNNTELLGEVYDLIVTDLVHLAGKKKSRWRAFERPGLISRKDAVKRLVKDGNWNGPYCKLIRLSFLKASGVRFPTDMLQGEDAVFLCRLLENDPVMYYRDAVSYGYDYSYSHSNHRFVKFPCRYIDDALHYHGAVKEQINNCGFSSVEREKLLTAWEETYVTVLFRLVLDSLKYKILTKDIQEQIQNAIEQTTYISYKEHSISYRLKILAIKMRNWHFLKVFVLLRILYHRIKGLY